MKTNITFTSEFLRNFKELIFITNFSGGGWCNTWEILTDENGEPFTDINKASKFIRASGRGWGVGLATFNQAILNNAEWDNL